MNTLFKLLLFFLLSFPVTYSVAQKANNDTTVCYKVSMDCMACKVKIEKNIAFEKGVKSLDVNLAEKTVKVKFNKTKNSPENLKLAIEKLKYKVEFLEVDEPTIK